MKCPKCQFDNPEDSKFCLECCIKLEDSQGQPEIACGYLFLGEHYFDTGHSEYALENLKKAEAEFQEMGMDFWLARTRGILERV